MSILFESVSIGACRIKNRFAMAPLGPLGMSDSEGGWSQRGIEYYVARARGGVGLIHTGIVFVENEIEEHARCNCPCATQNPAHFIRTSRELTERVHTYDARIFLQLTAGFGRVSVPKAWGIFPPVAPSEIQHRWKDVLCRPLKREEVHTLIKKFGDSAYYAKAAGFDGLQIHAVHEGYLLDQFAISLFNHRTDEYGGSMENRLRIVREIREEIARRCGADFPVTMRFSPKSFIKALRVGALPGESFEEQGRDLPEGLEVARRLEAFGYDGLDVDVGSYDAWWWSHPPMYQQRGLYLPYCQAVKQVVGIPVICAGRMDDPGMAVEAVTQGKCDIISLGRPLLADPDYVDKLRTGDRASIRPCIYCQEGCMGRVQNYSQLNCAVNAACGREADMELMPTRDPKKVLIVGGGPAGCEAARVLTLRGHHPILCEAGEKLGGSLLAGGVPDFKRDDLALAAWFAHELTRLGTDVRLNTKLDLSMIQTERPDVVLFATGGKARPLPGVEGEMVCSAKDALLGLHSVGERIVVDGSGTVACETALWYHKCGKQVTMVARGPGLLVNHHPSCAANTAMLKGLIQNRQIPVLTEARISGAADGNVLVCKQDGSMEELRADTVIVAIGYEPERELADACARLGCRTFVIGDANRVANIMYAVWDGFEAARTL